MCCSMSTIIIYLFVLHFTSDFETKLKEINKTILFFISFICYGCYTLHGNQLTKGLCETKFHCYLINEFYFCPMYPTFILSVTVNILAACYRHIVFTTEPIYIGFMERPFKYGRLRNNTA